jgi:acetolactate synthase small subunit
MKEDCISSFAAQDLTIQVGEQLAKQVEKLLSILKVVGSNNFSLKNEF